MTDTGNEYLNTVDRLEPDIVMIDPGAYYASAAISLKRIADVLEGVHKRRELTNICDQLARVAEVLETLERDRPIASRDQRR